MRMFNNCEIVMETLATIEYTPAWYYKHFPGFYNVECYNILADYSEHPEKYTVDENVLHDEGVEESKNSPESVQVLTSIDNDDESDEHVKKKCKISNKQVLV